MCNFQEWLNNRDKNYYNEIYDVQFDPAKQAGQSSGNPVFTRYTRPGETKLPKWMADKGYTSTMTYDTQIRNTKSFEVKENQGDKSVTISGNITLERDLEDQITGKQDFGRNVARIGGEQLLQKKDLNDRFENGKIVYKNAVIFLHDKFGQLKALLNFYLVRGGYEKAKIIAVSDALGYIDKIFKEYGSVNNFRKYAETMITKSIKSVCRDLGLIYDEKTYTVTKNTTGEKMARTERGPSRHQSGVGTYTAQGDKKYASDYRVNKDGYHQFKPIGFMDRSSR